MRGIFLELPEFDLINKSELINHERLINPNNFQSLKNLAIYYKSKDQPYLDYLKRAAEIKSDDEFIKSEYKNINNNENSNNNILYKDLNGFLKL